MKNFEYAHPGTVEQALELLRTPGKTTAILAGGTDLVGLMKRMVVTPDRVVNLGGIESLRHIETDATGAVWIGAGVHLDEFFEASATDAFPAAKQVIQGISSIQLQCQGTVVGELLRRPTCWYFRSGQGLLADRGKMVVEGDNRFHAILGNRGPAKFVSASRLAPALIALDARVRVVGPRADQETVLPLESLYRAPREDGEVEHVLQAGQFVTHVMIPRDQGRLSASYEVRHGEGPDQPLAAAAVALDVQAGIVRDARVVMGQVAPTPWISADAAKALRQQPLSEELAARAGREAVAGAMPLSHNQYKIQLAQVAVKRAIMRAAGMDVGDTPAGPPQLTPVIDLA